jgi:hypothetical protein
VNDKSWMAYIIIGQGFIVAACFAAMGYMLSGYHAHLEKNQAEMMTSISKMRTELKQEIDEIAREIQGLCRKIEAHDILLKMPYNQRRDLYIMEKEKK